LLAQYNLKIWGCLKILKNKKEKEEKSCFVAL